MIVLIKSECGYIYLFIKSLCIYTCKGPQLKKCCAALCQFWDLKIYFYKKVTVLLNAFFTFIVNLFTRQVDDVADCVPELAERNFKVKPKHKLWHST